MAQKEMTGITKERISEIIARIEMYGHGAGYTADEVLELAKIALAPCKDGKAMTLIDLLVKELSKGRGWPDGKDFCHLSITMPGSSRAMVLFGTRHKNYQSSKNDSLDGIICDISDLDRSAFTSVVTREQYEAALIASQKVDELESKALHWLRVAYEAGNYPDIPDSSVPAKGKGVPGERIRIKPHVYRELVNRLHDTAIKCAGTQQLREKISRVLGDVITPEHHKQAEKSGLERCHLEAALNIKPGHTLGIIDALLVHKMARALLPLVADKHEAGHANES
ncbi:TPA: hypothetical protein JZG45_005217 [Escherichia coli]|nr:hypothetical protein [Escherichia coli]